MRLRAKILLLIAPVLSACSRPVVRGERPPVVEAPEQSYEMADLKKRLWILPFTENTDPSPELQKIKAGALLSPKLVEVFNNEKSPFIVPESEQSSIKELGIDSSMATSDVAKMAHGTGITGFLRGEVTALELKESIAPEGFLKNKSIDLTFVVNYELFDASSGRRIASGSEKQVYNETRSDLFTTQTGLPEAAKKVGDLSLAMARKILAKVGPLAVKMGWEGKILKTDSTRIYINAGRRTGIKVGDTLKVVEEGSEIRDPQSGNFVGQAPGRVKGTLKVIQHFGLDGSIAVLQSGGSIRSGDRVELY